MLDPYQVNQRFFRRRCPVREMDGSQTVYHGSPLAGLVDIMRAERLVPQGHAELPDDEFLSVSINDNVLHLFSDGERLTGFAALPSMRIAHLDPFYCLCATSRAGVFDEGEEDLRWAARCAMVDQRGNPDMHGGTLRALLRDRGCHGLAFSCLSWCQWLGFHTGQWNDEAELALTESGCDEVWRSVCCLWVGGEEYDDLQEGWRAVAHAAIKADLLTRAEARPLLRRMDEIIEENRNAPPSHGPLENALALRPCA